MKTVCIASIALCLPLAALAETTIYKLVDQDGRVTYSNRPMKGAVVLELDPITTIAVAPAAAAKAEKPRVAVVTPIAPSLAAVDAQTQKRRDVDRLHILEGELRKEEDSLQHAREALEQEQRNPQLVAAVRLAQQEVDPTPARMIEMRQNIDKASGRIRGLQATVSEHERNIEALKKEIGALK